MYAYTTGTVDGAWRVQHRVRSILAEQYRSDPGGLPGNEDAGQMSSWYVLAGLGLYPVCPGCGGFSEYVISSPLFDKSRLAVGRNDDQKYFTISAVKSTQEVFLAQCRAFAIPCPLAINKIAGADSYFHSLTAIIGVYISGHLHSTRYI